MGQEFFTPVSPFGELNGWEVQGDNPTTAQQRAQALGSEGDEIAHKDFDKKTSFSATYVCAEDGAAVPLFGEILNGCHVDQIAVTFSNTAFVTMTVTGHKHGGANHPVCRKYKGSLTTIASKFGCPASIVGLTFPTDAGVNSITYTLTGQHVDVPGSQGEFLAADNYDGVETVDAELCDSGEITAAEGWSLTSCGNGKSNTAATTASATAEHHLAHEATT